jgi:hypothetical protein
MAPDTGKSRMSSLKNKKIIDLFHSLNIPLAED